MDFKNALAFIGFCVVAAITYMILKSIFNWIQRVIVGKYKIRIICKHEYKPYMKWYGGAHGINYEFKCQKCGKEKKIESYARAKEDNVF